MMETIRAAIVVTQELIDRSEPHMPRSCVVANALREQWGLEAGVLPHVTNSSDVIWCVRLPEVQIELPGETGRLAEQFDKSRAKARPGVYAVDIPANTRK